MIPGLYMNYKIIRMEGMLGSRLQRPQECPNVAVQDVVTRMNRTRLQLIAHIQLTAPPGTMGIDAILKAQKDAHDEAEVAMDLEQPGADSSDTKRHDRVPVAATGSYVPPAFLLHHIIHGTQATPIDMVKYIQHVFDQVLDEIALKESILEALETIAESKDSGEDELPPLLDQQLTNMLLLWELEPYVETAPERSLIEGSLGVLSWQLETLK
ncbi:hypothetical protein BGX31_007875 [Mortierella sp. GBA43]|nr:hypothetical protein BGX31_007875 [Mortierella sp. GBA43]